MTQQSQDNQPDDDAEQLGKQLTLCRFYDERRENNEY